MFEKNSYSFSFLPLTIRLETLGGVATPLLLRGTPLPTKRSDTFTTASDNQSSVEISLFIGESELTRNDNLLGKFLLDGIPPAPKAQPQIVVEFSVDQSCAVTVKASVIGGPNSNEQTFAPLQDLSEGFIAKVLAAADSTRESDEAALRQIEAVNRANTLISKAEEQLKTAANSKLSQAIADLGLALASGDSDAIREKSDVLNSAITTPSFNDIFGSFGDIFRTSTANRESPLTRKSEPAPRKRPMPPIQDIASTTNIRPLGKVFGGGTFTLNPQLCFVLMPFADKFKPIYDDHIKPNVLKAGLQCERADDIRGTNLITWDIWEKINRARFLIAELTDRNPNVFYELGLAHALSKDVILLTQSMEFVPFDLKSLRCIPYEFTPRGMLSLEKDLSGTIAALMKIG
jgi:hypothetical protein